MLNIKRIYEKPSEDDGYRILVDRVWPRGMAKDDANIDEWLKDIGPSNELRKWFGHDHDKWDEFKRKYFNELKQKSSELEIILSYMKKGDLTLLFGSRDTEFNNAVALRDYLEDEEKE